MTVKQGIVAELGGTDLLLPDLIARSLRANDQIKYYFALLQTARSNADQPQIPTPDLKAERIASKVVDTFLDDVIATTKRDPQSGYNIPHASEILERIEARIADMLACLPAAERGALETRVRSLALPKGDNGLVSGKGIDALTSGDREAGDSFHLVVMDAHRAINRLQSTIATETVDGAHFYGLAPGSRRLVAAFMKGLNETAPLKFNHPGLETTATQHDGQLLIQNDIGTTDAHVLIVRVESRTVTLTYTDIHRALDLPARSLFKV